MKKSANNGAFYVAVSLVAFALVFTVAGIGYAYSVVQNQYITNYYEAEQQPEAEGEPTFGAFPGGDVTLEDVTIGSSRSVGLDFTPGATTTPGKLFKLFNHSQDKLCTVSIVDVTTGTSLGGRDGDGAPLEISVATSTLADALSGNIGVIASTTLATSTTGIIDNVRNPGTYVGADQDIGGAPFAWDKGVWLLGQFDAYTELDDRTSATSSDTYSGVAGKAYIHCVTR